MGKWFSIISNNNHTNIGTDTNTQSNSHLFASFLFAALIYCRQFVSVFRPPPPLPSLSSCTLVCIRGFVIILDKVGKMHFAHTNSVASSLAHFPHILMKNESKSLVLHFIVQIFLYFSAARMFQMPFFRIIYINKMFIHTRANRVQLLLILPARRIQNE